MKSLRSLAASEKLSLRSKNPPLPCKQNIPPVIFSNGGTVSYFVLVSDREPPTVVTCEDVFSNSTNAVDYDLPTATDNVGVTEMEASMPPGSVFQEGVTEVFVTFSDASNNNATCAFNVTVVRKSTLVCCKGGCQW